MSGNQEPTNQTTFSHNNIATVHSASGNITDVSQYIVQNLNDINSLIESLRKRAQEFPENQREEALTHLEDLQEAIDKPEKQKSPRIKALLVALGTVGAMVVAGTDFLNNLLELSEKLGVPIELAQPQTAQQLPQSTLQQIDLQSQGIDRAQAEVLRANLKIFADDWNSPEMSIYDNYDAVKANRKTR
ncbi:hypothetical protein [Scytonema hofmannii]|uniref:hypothetical protein n=1 Tax=Scytonema hofmannii TaxID=34078 RepID=UPI0003453F42|nr:hypothetical protein [Scytonema hofmannii]